MSNAYATLAFFFVYFLSYNFMYAIFVFSLLETLPVLLSLLTKRSAPLSKLAPLLLLWLSLFLTWTFQSPLFFQYKTSVIYGSIALFMLLAPISWLESASSLFSQQPLDRSMLQALSPQIAKTLFLACLINALAIQVLSLPSWMVFKLILATGLSGRLLMLVYPYLMQGATMNAYSSTQEVSAEVIEVSCEKIES